MCEVLPVLRVTEKCCSDCLCVPSVMFVLVFHIESMCFCSSRDVKECVTCVASERKVLMRLWLRPLSDVCVGIACSFCVSELAGGM